MEFRVCSILSVLIIFTLLYPQAKGEDFGSVFFIERSSHHFLRPRSFSDEVEHPTMLLQEVGAAVSVLLGFAPPSTLSAAGSSKLNEVLVRNPFNRPHAVFLLEVKGVDDLKQIVQDNELFSYAFTSANILGSDKADIQVPDDDDVSVVSLDEPLDDCTDKEISDYASFMGESYSPDMKEPLNGVLTIPLANVAMVNPLLSKKSEKGFAVVLSLIRDVKRAIQMHEDLSQSSQVPAELLAGCFDGIKVLQEQYGAENVAQHGVELLLATVTKIFGSLQEAFKGQIVGVIYFHSINSQKLGKKFDVMFASNQAVRWMAETKGSPEVVLVRRTLAWVTRVILLISSFIGSKKSLRSTRAYRFSGWFLILLYLLVAEIGGTGASRPPQDRPHEMRERLSYPPPPAYAPTASIKNRKLLETSGTGASRPPQDRPHEIRERLSYPPPPAYAPTASIKNRKLLETGGTGASRPPQDRPHEIRERLSYPPPPAYAPTASIKNRKLLDTGGIAASRPPQDRPHEIRERLSYPPPPAYAPTASIKDRKLLETGGTVASRPPQDRPHEIRERLSYLPPPTYAPAASIKNRKLLETGGTAASWPPQDRPHEIRERLSYPPPPAYAPATSILEIGGTVVSRPPQDRSHDIRERLSYPPPLAYAPTALIKNRKLLETGGTTASRPPQDRPHEIRERLSSPPSAYAPAVS